MLMFYFIVVGNYDSEQCPMRRPVEKKSLDENNSDLIVIK